MPTTVILTFKYNPFGRRIEKISPTTTSIFAYDGDNLIEEANSSGVVVARYTQGQNIDEPLAESRSSSTSFYEADGLGSVTSLSNSSGTLAQTYTYDSFGKLTTSSGSVTNPFQYTGREFDSETGLYYYRARYYDPNAGRFLSEDPTEFIAGVDFYTYTHNDPADYFDPSGLQDYNQQQTQALLQQVYVSATAGRIQGLRNIYSNSSSGGQYDFGWNEHIHDTWTWCGKKMNADQFGNFVAGFEGAAYDRYYFWTTGAIWAQSTVEVAGVIYHLRGETKSKDDKLDRTGRPDIRNGEGVGWNFAKNNAGCGCSNGGGVR